MRIEFERLFRAAFLQEAEKRIENHDRENDRGVQPEAQHQLDEAGGEQDVDKDVAELGEEPHQRPLLLGLRQAVRPVSPQPFGGFRAVQTSARIDPELLLNLFRRDGVPGGRRPIPKLASPLCSPSILPRAFVSDLDRLSEHYARQGRGASQVVLPDQGDGSVERQE